MSPDWSLATHRLDDEQAIFQMVVSTTGVLTQAAGPPVGSVDVRIDPPPVTAAQKEGVGQEMPQSVCAPATSVLLQVGGLSVGSVEVRTPPDPSDAAQKVTVGQDSPLIQLPGSAVVFCQWGGTAPAADVSKM
jgi:hypothetical protein